MRGGSRIIVGSALLALAGGASACSSDRNEVGGAYGTSTTGISGSLEEWSVSVDATSALAGDVSLCNLPDHYGNGMFTGFEVVG